MEINLNQIIKGIGKKPFKDEDGQDLILKKAILLAMVSNPSPQEPKESVENSLKLRKLFDRLDEAEDKIDLKIEEIVKLKEIANFRLVPFLGSSVIQLLDPDK